MSVIVLVHGGAGSAQGWDLVSEQLARIGHEAISMDLPCDDPEADWSDYAAAVEAAVKERGSVDEVIVVAHSAGGFVAPLVCERLPVRMIVLASAMIPAPGETFMQWWENTGHLQEVATDWEDPDTFYNGVPSELAEKDVESTEGRENIPHGPWPLNSWPDVPTKFLLFRDDRVFPSKFIRRVARERLGIVADEMDGGHCAILSHPRELAENLDYYAKEDA